MKFKKIITPFLIGALAFSLAACGKDKKEDADKSTPEDNAGIEEMQKNLAKQQVENDIVVAVVNDEEITGERYNAILQSVQMEFLQSGQDPTAENASETIKTQTLDAIVNQTWLIQQANKADITVEDTEIDEDYAGFIEQFDGDEEALKDALAAENQTVETFKEQIKEKIVFEKYQNSIITEEDVTEEEIEEFYEEFIAMSEGNDEEEPPALEDLRETIVSFIEQDKQQKQVLAHLDELKKDAQIELKI